MTEVIGDDGGLYPYCPKCEQKVEEVDILNLAVVSIDLFSFKSCNFIGETRDLRHLKRVGDSLYECTKCHTRLKLSQRSEDIMVNGG